MARWLASGHTPPQTPRLSLVSAYRLADYLDQHGRRAHRSVIPSARFWTAAASFAAPGDLEALARAAAGRGLLRDAARLRKRAAAHGDTRAAAALVKSLHSLHPADSAPARWAAAHASLHDPAAVTELLEELREAGAGAQAAVLLARDPAAHASLDNPAAVAMLLQGLREAGAGAQVAALADRAAAHASLDDPFAVTELLRELREAAPVPRSRCCLPVTPPRTPASTTRSPSPGCCGSCGRRALTPRPRLWPALPPRTPASTTRPPSPSCCRALREVGAGAQVAALLARDPAAHASLDDPAAVASLLRELRMAGVGAQATALLARDPAAHASLDDPAAVASLLRELRMAGAGAQVAALAGRVAAHASLDNPVAVTKLLQGLQWAGAGAQAALLARDPAAHASLDDPDAVASLLRELREAVAGARSRRCLPVTPPRTPASTTRTPLPYCWGHCGRRAPVPRPRHWPAAPPRTPALTTRTPSSGCCGHWGRRAPTPRPQHWRRDFLQGVCLISSRSRPIIRGPIYSAVNRTAALLQVGLERPGLIENVT